MQAGHEASPKSQTQAGMYYCASGDLLIEVHSTSEKGKTSQDRVVSGGVTGELCRMKRVKNHFSKINYLYVHEREVLSL